jgi:hypothetical protein
MPRPHARVRRQTPVGPSVRRAHERPPESSHGCARFVEHGAETAIDGVRQYVGPTLRVAVDVTHWTPVERQLFREHLTNLGGAKQ